MIARRYRFSLYCKVMQVFREEFEETQNRYKRVVKVIERAPKKEPNDQKKGEIIDIVEIGQSEKPPMLWSAWRFFENFKGLVPLLRYRIIYILTYED